MDGPFERRLHAIVERSLPRSRGEHGPPRSFPCSAEFDVPLEVVIPRVIEGAASRVRFGLNRVRVELAARVDVASV
jgi:hypothetical protein